MTKASPMQTAFTSGEWSPLMAGHVNLEKRADSSVLVQNLICLKQGPMTRRGGTYFIKEVKNSAHNTVLIPFEYSNTVSYNIEMGDEYFRFFKNNSIITLTAQNITGITKADPAVLTYSGSDTYSNGDEVFINGVVGMTEVNNKFYRVANVNAVSNTFELNDTDGNAVDSSDYTSWSSGGTVAKVYQVTTPYQQEDLVLDNGAHNFQTSQSADVLYIVSDDYAPMALVRYADANWLLNTLIFDDGPYLDENTTATTLALSGTSGSVTVTASAVAGINGGSGFLSTDVGRLIRWHDGSNWTWLKITARTDTTHVTATVSGANAGGTSATERWRLGVFSDTTGWPRVICFFQNRMVLMGCDAYPDRYDMSRKAGYSDTTIYYAPSDADGTVTDDASISGTLPSGRVNIINWAAPDERGLIIGTTDGEWIVSADTTSDVLSPTNYKEVPVSSIGGAYVQAITAESGALFMQRAGRRLHDVVYSFELDRLKPRDLTLTAEHMTRTGVVGMVFQKEPLNVIWSRRSDGLLLGMTYYPDQGVFAWHRHPLGGTDAEVKSMCVNPSSDGTKDVLTLIVERTINEVTRKYIEYVTPYYEDDTDQEDAVCMDCALKYDGAATTRVTGLEHLEGETVKVMRDGKSHPDLTVTNGSITLANNREGSVIIVGLGNTWAWKSVKIEAGSQDGVAQGKTKRITKFVVRLLNTLGLNYGTSQTAGEYDSYDFNQGSEYDETVALYSGDTEFLSFPAGYSKDGQIYLWHDGVFPVTIQAVMPQLVTQDG